VRAHDDTERLAVVCIFGWRVLYMVHPCWDSMRLRPLLAYGVRAAMMHTTMIEFTTWHLFRKHLVQVQTCDIHWFMHTRGGCSSKVTTRVGPMRVSLNTSRRPSTTSKTPTATHNIT
jgi:hypothetical protein